MGKMSISVPVGTMPVSVSITVSIAMSISVSVSVSMSVALCVSATGAGDSIELSRADSAADLAGDSVDILLCLGIGGINVVVTVVNAGGGAGNDGSKNNEELHDNAGCVIRLGLMTFSCIMRGLYMLQ